MRTCSRCARPVAAISPRTKRSSSGQSAAIAVLPQPMRVCGREIEPIDRLERLDLAQGSGRERRLALEGVQHDALEQITEGQIELGRERLEDLEQAALEAHARLGAGEGLHGTNSNLVPRYQSRIDLALRLVPGAARMGGRLARYYRAQPDGV